MLALIKNIYLFVYVRGLWYWRRLKGQTSFNEPRRVDTFWKQLSGGFSAVYENIEKDIVRFFKGLILLQALFLF